MPYSALFHCNICDKDFEITDKEFLDKWVKSDGWRVPRPEVKCPHCGD